MDDTTDLAKLAIAWGSDVPIEQEELFLRLTEEQRSIALLRIEILQGLRGDSRPSPSEQGIAADRLDISIPRLQALMRAWKDPSVSVAAPHSSHAKRRRKPNPGRDIAERIVHKAIGRDRFAAEPSLHRRIQRICTRLGCAPPARMTVRRILDRERLANPIDIAELEQSQTDDRRPPRPGETILVTSVSFDATIASPGENGLRRASALIFVDAGSGLLEAVDYALGLAALGVAASDRIADASPVFTADWRRPTQLILAPPLPPQEEWRRSLLRAAERHAVDVTEELYTRTRRWVAGFQWHGPKGLSPSSGLPDDDVHPDWPLLSESEFRSALEDSVDRRMIMTERTLDAQMPDGPIVSEVMAAASIIRSLLGNERAA